MKVLDYKVAKAAREALNLSQATIANDIGLSRPDLSKFENGKMILPDEVLTKLKEYFIEVGGLDKLSEDELLKTPSILPEYRVRDGIVIANHIDDDDIEVLMSEYQHNEKEIQRLAGLPLTKAVRKQEDSENAIPSLRCLTHRQYAIIQALQGKVDIAGEFANDEDQLFTAGQYTDALGCKKLSHTGEELPERLEFSLFSQVVPENSGNDSEGGLLGLVVATGAIVGGVALTLLSAAR